MNRVKSEWWVSFTPPCLSCWQTQISSRKQSGLFHRGLPHNIYLTSMFTVNAPMLKLLKCTLRAPPTIPLHPSFSSVVHSPIQDRKQILFLNSQGASEREWSNPSKHQGAPAVLLIVWTMIWWTRWITSEYQSGEPRLKGFSLWFINLHPLAGMNFSSLIGFLNVQLRR